MKLIGLHSSRFVPLGFAVPLVTLSLIPLIPVSASAQLRSASAGMKGGLNLASFHGADIGDSQTRRGTTLGAFVQLGLGGAFSLQPEVIYTEKGAKEAELLDAGTNGLWSYNYVDFVVLLKLHVTPKQSSPSLSLFTGPVVSVLSTAKATGNLPEGLYRDCMLCGRRLQAPPFATLLEHETKTADFGGTVGVGIDFGSGPAKLVLDARYTRMIREFDEAPYAGIYSRKHKGLIFQVGMSFSRAAFGGGRIRPSSPTDDPTRHSIVTLDVITREDIDARGEALSLYDIIRLERPEWMDGGDIRATLFVDGRLWDGSPELLRERRGAEVEEVLRMEGAPGAYQGHGVVIEIITRGGA